MLDMMLNILSVIINLLSGLVKFGAEFKCFWGLHQKLAAIAIRGAC